MLTFYPTDPQLVQGGVRMVALNLVEALRHEPGLELHVVHCHSDIAADRLVQQGNVTLHYLAMPRQRLLPNLVTSVSRLGRTLREIQPDVVHAHAGHFAYAAVRAGYPTLYTIHGVLPNELKIYNTTLYDRLRYGLLAYYERRALPNVQQVVAISAHVVEAYRDQGSEKWVRIDNPVPAAMFDLCDRAEAGRILYVGTIDERKDLLTLLRALRRLREGGVAAQVIVAGRVNNPAYEAQVRAYLAAHALDGAVHLLGLVERPRLMEEYERCAVLALPSREENAPLVVLEAMAAGKPVVATRVGGVPDLVAEGETGYIVPSGDDAAMAQRLGELLGDAAMRAQMGQRARVVARERFHVARIAQRYYELYRRLAQPPRAG
jgi:glycosyltransferase involved in cell wall biosynthesis